ncbi:cation efflux protein [Lucifera butyrica]|uniref:Cation efflux protein n=1 Tax=Lucifera butyrica TaxID=1351585 RepID=A0A498REU0_9FIRM|nr:cation diffusion facilitator family transporter [Lucifera butyrica]VBB07698.1 cation efflux protein [Lucifera butyrica]
MQSAKSLSLSIFLTAFHFAAKLIGGYITNSLALVSDAWHLLTDLLSLIISWWAIKKAVQPPNAWATYGFHRVGILAALVNNVSLVAVSFYILYQAYLRFLHPETIETAGMSILAIVGIIISAAIVYLIHDGAKNNLNMRSVWLHFAGETCASIGVLAGGVVIYFTHWYWIDTFLSGILGLTILRGALIMLKDIIIILLEGIPDNLSLQEITACLNQLPDVTAARDIHVWCLAEEQIALSAHIEIASDIPLSQTEPLLKQIKEMLAGTFHITHVNIQFELHECRDCHHV